jgi:ATP-dependent DNA ligase
MSSIPTFPTLFAVSSHGKRKIWSVAVVDRDGHGVIVTSHGYEDGKQVINERVVTVGKNIGKRNETTPVAQAISEAQSLWNKKRDAAYAEDGAKPSEGGGAGDSASDTSSDEDSAPVAPAPTTDVVPLPMLAQDFNKRAKSMKFPCYAQRKLDGVRCVAISGRGLFSRNGKPTSPHLTHIQADINSLPVGTILDGELYSDELTFQEIVGLVKKATLKPGDAEKVKKIYLCVYDTIRPGVNTERIAWLADLFTSRTFAALRLLPTAVCGSLEEVKTLHAAYVAEGYEGIMLRNGGGLYKVGHRSVDLMKYKEFEDAEYTVCGFKEGDGVEKGCVVWVCRTPAGQEFNVRPRGTHEDRQAAFLSGATMLGKKLTVRYQELTNDGIPRFPVGIAFRDYE